MPTRSYCSYLFNKHKGIEVASIMPRSVIPAGVNDLRRTVGTVGTVVAALRCAVTKRCTPSKFCHICQLGVSGSFPNSEYNEGRPERKYSVKIMQNVNKSDPDQPINKI